MKRQAVAALGIMFALGMMATGCSSRNTPTAATTSGSARNSAGYVEWSVRDLKLALEKKDFVFVNVHIPFEGKIDGTDLEIPFDEITTPKFLATLPADKNARVVLYCRSGSMSNTAANALVKLGYTNVVDVKGGMRAWQAAGYELILVHH